MKKNTFKRIVTVGAVLAGVAVFIASILNKRENENEEYCTPKALRKAAKNQATFYEKYVKRGLDIECLKNVINESKYEGCSNASAQ